MNAIVLKATLFAALAAGMTGCAAPQTMNVASSGTGAPGSPCVAKVDGRTVPLDDFYAFARRWRGRQAHLIADINTPYRCLGRIIFELQRAGFRKIGFISAPPEAEQ